MTRPRLATTFAGFAGLVFGLGLVISGMTRPAKVQGFLDVTGAWDPSLAFVMVGAIAVHFVLLRVVRRRRAPLFGATFHLPTRNDLDPKLIGGAAIFGVGWGLGGICPGPALVDLGSGLAPAAVFVAAMAIGMVIQKAVSGEARSVLRPVSERSNDATALVALQPRKESSV